MKDLYSFSRDKAEHDEFYERCAAAYAKVFERLGIGEITYRTFASGGSFSKYSDEFQTISPVGEDKIYVHEGKRIAVNEEVYNDEVLADLGLKKEELVEKTAVEVGNIFTLGTKYSDALDLRYTKEDGSSEAVFMGSYGIGPSRLMGLLAEHFADEHGLVWPKGVAPYQVYLVAVGEDQAVVKASTELYDQLSELGYEVIYDDRDERAGAKFADADLLGIPIRLVISPKTLEQKSAEVKLRSETEAKLVPIAELKDWLAQQI